MFPLPGRVSGAFDLNDTGFIVEPNIIVVCVLDDFGSLNALVGPVLLG
jgi:hypothetical protein